MKTNSTWYFSSRISFWIGAIGAVVGILLGILAGLQPLLVIAPIFALIVSLCFLTNFEQSVLGLLIVRSSLDLFSEQDITALFAVGLNLLTLLYLALRLLSGKSIQTDKFWWLFAAWIGLQSVWVIFLGLGELGFDSGYTSEAFREWLRLFSWLMIYLLVLQLKHSLHPERLILPLFLSIVAPLTVALMQLVVPDSALPSLLRIQLVDGVTFRIHGTLGHPNAFATFLVLFLSLTVWKIDSSKKRLPWLILIGVLIFFLVATKALFSLGMLGVFLIAFIAQHLTLGKVVSGVLIFIVFIGLFASTDYGLQRLSSLANLPIINPDIDVSRAILLQRTYIDSNSFNWRVTQWNYLFEAWKSHPIFGYGLQTSLRLTPLDNYPHNDYLKALVEEGLVGLGLFIAFLGCQLGRIVNALRSSVPGSSHHSFCKVVLALFLAQLVAMLTDNVLSHMSFFIYWWLLVAVIDWNWEQDRQLSKEKAI